MNKLIQGADGEMSGSKAAFMATLAVILFKVLIGGITYEGFTSVPPDYAGMGVLIAAVGAVYAARNHKPKGDKDA